MTTTSLETKKQGGGDLMGGGLPERRCRSAGGRLGCNGNDIEGAEENRRRLQIAAASAADRKYAAARLNNIGAALIDRHSSSGGAAGAGDASDEHGRDREARKEAEYYCDRAIEILRDAVETLTARKDGLHGGYAFELAKAEACLSRADEKARCKKQKEARKEDKGDETETESSSSSSSSSSSFWDDRNTFRLSSSLEVELPPASSSTPIDTSSEEERANDRDSNRNNVVIGSQGLLTVLLYNLALAHTISGTSLGRESTIDKATSLYKMTENLLLRQANEDPRGLRGVDVTYLARSVVNNMGIILFEWGRPADAGEYFEGLTSICFDFYDEDEDGDEGARAGRGRRSGSGGGKARRDWNAFEVNALIARGLNASPAA